MIGDRRLAESKQRREEGAEHRQGASRDGDIGDRRWVERKYRDEDIGDRRWMERK